VSHYFPETSVSPSLGSCREGKGSAGVSTLRCCRATVVTRYLTSYPPFKSLHLPLYLTSYPSLPPHRLVRSQSRPHSRREVKGKEIRQPDTVVLSTLTLLCLTSYPCSTLYRWLVLIIQTQTHLPRPDPDPIQATSPETTPTT
jgi:hypothetical protein